MSGSPASVENAASELAGTAQMKGPASGKPAENPKGRYNILAALGVNQSSQDEGAGKADTPNQTWLLQKLPRQEQQANKQEKQLQMLQKQQPQQKQQHNTQKSEQNSLSLRKQRNPQKQQKQDIKLGAKGDKLNLKKLHLQEPEQLLASTVVEGVVERRVDFDDQQDSSPSRTLQSFQVWLRTASSVLQVNFTGPAAHAFSSSLGLSEGGRVRLEGFETPPEKVKELHFHDVRHGVRVSVLAAPSKSGHIKELQDLKQAARAQAPVDVEATVESVGELESCELALEPGEFVCTRSLWVRCAGANQRCRWRLWASQAERHGHGLIGQRILIRGTRVHEVKGLCELTGSAKVELLISDAYLRWSENDQIP